MTATTEELYREWRIAYLAIDRAIDLAESAPTYSEECAIRRKHEDPHVQHQIRIEDTIFAAPTETMQELAVKILLAFAHTNEPNDAHRQSLVADAVRITALPATPNANEGAN